MVHLAPKKTVDSSGQDAHITDLQFGMFGSGEITALAEFELVSDKGYEQPHRVPVAGGVVDRRLGVSDKMNVCSTCGSRMNDCPGHYGYIKLELPIFHIGYLKPMLSVLQAICKSCSRVLLPMPTRQKMLRQISHPMVAGDSVRRAAAFKRMVEECKKVRWCPYCEAANGTVRRYGSMKIVHEKYPPKQKGEKAEQQRRAFHATFETAVKAGKGGFENAQHQGKDLIPLLPSAQDDLNPLRVLALFKAIPEVDFPLLNMSEQYGKPETLIVDRILVPPIPIRPSVDAGAAGSNEDDLTIKLADMIKVNNIIRCAMEGGKALVHHVMEDWEYLQLQYSLYLQGPSVPGVRAEWQDQKKPIRSFTQRLKGKQGRFRGNLSGKRVDFSGRTVISPDPNLKIDELCVPIHMAKVFTFPQRVFAHNLSQLRQLVTNGPDVWPGANYVEIYSETNAEPFKRSLRFGDRRRTANELKVGDLVERHLTDGDVVLFNRQPSLHKLSIMAHRARVMDGRTLRFNECVCAPYNADFDGDEMNIHVPQTEEARAEALLLMGVLSNLVTPRNGEIVVSATQDFLTGAFKLTLQSAFFTRSQFCLLCAYMSDGSEQIDLPAPAIIKPVEMWTGKQVFSVILCPCRTSPLRVNLETKNKKYNSMKLSPEPFHMCPDDGWVCFRNGELMCGVIDKSIIGGGNKESLFAVLLRDFSAEASALCMSRLAKLTARFLAEHGFSIGIQDVQANAAIKKKQETLFSRGYADCNVLLEQFERGTLPQAPGCTLEQTLESEMNARLSQIRDDAGDVCKKELHHLNAPLTMATCGSKGSWNNVAQMVVCVGQQSVNGKRMPNGFVHRSLPHFPRHSRAPAAKGFVANSFYTGLHPTEFFFHTMGGREGLVDTAVKTAETGYMARRLMKALEDLAVEYDGSVRNSEGNLIQFRFGDDGLDPAYMEDRGGRPLNFDRVYLNEKCRYHHGEHKPISADELRAVLDEHIQSPSFKKTVKRNIKNVPSNYEMRLRQFVEKIAMQYHMLEENKSIKQPSEVVVKGEADVAEANNGPNPSKARRKRRAIVYDNEEEEDEAPEGAEKPEAVKGEVGVDMHEAPLESDGAVTASEAERQRGLQRLSRAQAVAMLEKCLVKYSGARVEPGSAVGAVGAQSIGEPGTQMTLKTFHFAGVASMNITQGVPRIKEIINASKTVATPIVSVALDDPHDMSSARLVKGRCERCELGAVCRAISRVITQSECYLLFDLDLAKIADLRLELTAHQVRRSLLNAPKVKIKETDVEVASKSAVRVYATRCEREDNVLYEMDKLRLQLMKVRVCGIENVSRAIIVAKLESEKTEEEKRTGRPCYKLLIEGTALQAVMGVKGIKGSEARSTHVMEVEKCLGIEAARSTIVHEIQDVMKNHGMDIDVRHVALLADVMTFRGEVLGITRFGMPKMSQSVLSLASFEKTTDHLYDAAFHARNTPIRGVSECIIMGIPIKLGTGLFNLLHRTPKLKLPPPHEKLLFPSLRKHK